MTILSAILLGVGPAIFWLAYFRRKDRHEPEPRALLLSTFCLGALAIVPAGLLEALAGFRISADEPISLRSFATPAIAFLVIAPIEETAKFLAVRLHAYRSAEFDEPIDGLIYAATAALGFAAVENVLYILALEANVMVGRALFATLGHVTFAIPWGLALGLRRCVPGTRPIVVAAGLAIGILLHGVYDALLFSQHPVALAIFVLVAFPAMVVSTHLAFRHVAPLSPYLDGRSCTACGELLRVRAAFCTACGAAAGVAGGP